jgi:xanthine dehydrogenase accessory factor
VAAIFQELARMQANGERGVLVVVTDVDGHAPQVVGAKMIVRPDRSIVGTIGGGRVEHVVQDRALAVLESGRADRASFQLKAELGMCCGGRMEVYMEPVVVTERLFLFGAGHVAEPTCAFAAECGFEVTVIDERPDFNTEARFPGATRRHVAEHGDVFSSLEISARDYVVITTHNHDYDRDILARCLRTDARYIGMIGSTQKVKKTFSQLRLEGLTDADLARACTPIGLDIFAETPAEIAVSIVGELIRQRREDGSGKKTRGAEVVSLKQGGGS